MYNAEEVYRIGVEIEKNGKRFYELTAEAAVDDDIRSLLRELAEWENSHIALFEKLADELPETARSGDTLDPDNEMQRYLKAAADSHVFLQRTLDIPALAAGCRSAGDVLELAMKFEKDSVVLYAALKPMVPKGLGRNTIGRLAREEISHVSLIQEKLALLKGE